MPPKFFNYSIDDDTKGYLSPKNLRFFASDILLRGEEYFREGRVKITYSDVEAGEFHANVKGSEVYAVRLDFKGNLLSKASCNCPYAGRGHCKHEAALLYAINQEFSFFSTTRVNDEALKETKTSGIEGARSVVAFENKLYSFGRSLPDTIEGERNFLLAILPYYEASIISLPSFAPEMLAKVFLALESCFSKVNDGGESVTSINKEFEKVFSSSSTLRGMMGRFLNTLGDYYSSLAFAEMLLGPLKETALDAYRISLTSQGRHGWANLLYCNSGNPFLFFSRLDDKTVKLTMDSLSYGDYVYDVFAKAIVNSKNVNWLLEIMKAHGADIVPSSCREEAIDTLLKNNQRPYAVSLSLLSLGYCSFPSFMKVFHALTLEERKANASRLESVARAGRFYNSYSIMASPVGIRGYSFTGIPVYDLPLITQELDSSAPSFFVALKKKIDPMISKGLSNANGPDIYALLSLIELYPELKDYLLDSSLMELSFVSSSLRVRYLSLLRKYSLFSSVGTRRYK